MIVSTPHTDWINTAPVFYHEKTGKYATNPLEVVDFDRFEWDWEGLAHYMDYGYCVFTKTPIKHVRFLPPGTAQPQHGGITAPKTQLQEWFEALRTRTTPDEVLALLEAKIRRWREAHQDRSIVLPLSGGLDSRLLLYHLRGVSNLRTFTYGASLKQHQHEEVVRAQWLAAQEKVPWEQIELREFPAYRRTWYDLFGFSTHAHGMYHMEFYKKIKARISAEATKPPIVVSGFIGDIWAGSIYPEPIARPEDLQRLGYTHGICAESRFLQKPPVHFPVRDAFFEAQRPYLHDRRYLVLLTMQNKVMLLRYLTQVPEAQGYETFAPYGDQELALSMLNLPESEREGRVWQHRFLEHIGLSVERQQLPASTENYFNHQGVMHTPLEPLSVSLLREVVRPSYVEQINRNLLDSKAQRRSLWWYRHLRHTRFLRRFVRDRFIGNYFAYMTLYPLQELIKARDAYLKKT